MNEIDNHYLWHLGTMHQLLHRPDVRRDKSGNIRNFNLPTRICLFVSKIFVYLDRFFYRLLFWDKHVYNELKAREVVNHYIHRVPKHLRTRRQSEQILKIYNTLLHIREGDKTYGDSIDKKKIAQLNSPTFLEQKQFFHLHGNRFGQNSKWEGLSQSSAIKCFQTYLTKRCTIAPHPAIKKMLSKLPAALEIAENHNPQEFVTCMQKNLEKAFKEKTSLLIPAGWTATKLGHIIYLEVFEEYDGITLRIYNTGEGISHHNKAIVGNKVKHSPYVEWRGIKKEKILDKFFLQALAEMKLFPKMTHTPENCDYNSNDIYVVWKKILKPTSTNENEVPKICISPQSAGICSMKGLFAVLRTYYEELGKTEVKDYKRLKCDIRIQSFIDLHLTPKPKPAQWRLINKSFQKTCRSVDRLFSKNIVGYHYVSEANNHLTPIKKWLERHKDVVTKKNSLSASIYNYPISLPLSSSDTPLYKLSYFISRGGHFDGRVTTESLIKLETHDSKNLLETIDKALDVCAKVGLDKENQALYTGLISFINKLPLDAKAWDEACESSEDQKQKIFKIITSLGDIGSTLFILCQKVFGKDVVTSEKILAINKLQLIFSKLISKLGFDIPQSPTEELLQTPNFFVCTRPTDYEELKQSNSILSHAISTMQSNHSLKIEMRSEESSYEFITGLFRLIEPECMEKIAAEFPDFDQLTTVSRNSRILTSRKLPEWLIALINIDLYKKFLENSGIQTFSSSKMEDYECNFELQDFADRCEINVSYPRVNNTKPYNFELMHAAKTHPPMALIKILKILKPLSEKDLGKVAKKLSDDKPEEIKSLAHIFLDPNTQVAEALEYFSKNPAKMKERGYQILFRLALFSPGVLQLSLKCKGITEVLKKFLDYHIENWAHHNEIQICAFLIQCKRFLHNYDPKLFPNTLPSIRELLLLPGLDEKQKSLLYSEALAMLANIHENLTEEDLQLLLAGMIFLNKYPRAELDNELTDSDARKAYYLHTEALVKYLDVETQLQNQRFNAILKSLNLCEMDISWKKVVPKDNDKIQDHLKVLQKEEKFLKRKQKKSIKEPKYLKKGQNKALEERKEILTLEMENISLRVNILELLKKEEPPFHFESCDGRFQFNPLEGYFFDKEKEDDPLPIEIIQNQNFSQLFPNIQKAKCLGNSLYTFKDKQGFETVVLNGYGSINIEQKVGKRWMRFLSKNHFNVQNINKKSSGALTVCVLQSRFLLNQFTHWQYIDYPERILLREIDKNEFSFEVRLSEKADDKYYLKQIIDLKTNWNLQIEIDQYLQFEQSFYTHYWADEEGHLKKIEFPRYALSFTCEEDKYFSDQFSGYFIVEERAKALGSYQHYIMLKNDEGKKKILLPKLKYFAPLHKEVFDTYFGIDPEVIVIKRQVFDFDINAENMPFSQSREANLYLVQALIAAQEYQTAATYLKKYGRKLTPFTKAEEAILVSICSLKNVTGDNDGNAAALSTFAGYLLMKKGFTENWIQVKECYRSYLENLQNPTVIRLLPHEEKFLLNTLLQEMYVELFHFRLQMIESESAHTFKNPVQGSWTQTINYSYSTNMNRLSFIWDHKSLNFKFPDRSKILMTRIGREVSINFWSYYAMALKGSQDDKEWLSHALYFARSVNSQTPWEDIDLLESVLENPKKFSMPQLENGVVDVDALKKFAVGLVNTHKRIRTKENIPQVIRSRKTPNLTSEEFEIEFDSKPKQKEERLEFKPLPTTTWADSATEWFEIQEVRNPTLSKDFENWIVQRLKVAEKDPLEHQAYKSLQTDLANLRNQSTSRYVLNDGVDLDSIKDNLELGKEEALQKLEKLKAKILELANVSYLYSYQADQAEMMKRAGKLQPLTLEQCIVCFARQLQRPDALFQRNPALTQDNVKELYALIHQYLMLATQEQQRSRCLEIFDKMKSENEEVKEELFNQLCQDLSTVRTDARAYLLAFEYFAGVILRPEQIEKIDAFIQKKNPNIIMEMLMGFGKSKILLPLLALLLAEKDCLALLVTPQSLFENISSHMQGILKDAFGQTLHSLDFDRDTTFDQHTLRNILRDIKSIKENGDCLIMTSKSLFCLILKFVEAFDKYCKGKDQDAQLSVELKLMQQILNQFDAAKTIIDEADTVLNVLKSVCFSLGEPKAVIEYEVQTIFLIYYALYCDEEIKKMVRLESDPSPNSSAVALTEQNYHTLIKKDLATFVVELLANAEDNNSPHYQKAVPVFKEIHKRDWKVKLLIAYLCRDEEYLTEATKFYESQIPEVQDIIALAGHVISQFLPHTLTRVCNEKYGMDKMIAIPFHAVNTPILGSQFANRHITMMYTFQAIFKNGVDSKVVETTLRKLQSKALKEQVEEDGKITIAETEAFGEFSVMRGKVDMPLFNYSTAQLTALINSINASPIEKLRIAMYTLTENLTLFDEQISCNPQNLVSFLPSVSGFTGTLWNAQSLHRKLHPMAAEGISAKSLELLFRNSRHSILSLEISSTKRMLEQLGKEQFDLIIDSGGYFKEGNNETIAREISKHCQKPVVFLNEIGEQTITDGTKEMPLAISSVALDQRITFLDQDHTIGVDIKYKTDAVAILTCGPLMLERDFKQGAWRMRGLDKLQRVKFALSNDVTLMIRDRSNLRANEKIALDHILQFFISNQCVQQSRNNFQSFLQQLWDIPQQILLRVLKNEKLSSSQYRSVFDILRNLWIKKSINSSAEMYGKVAQLRAPDLIIEEECQKCESFLNNTLGAEKDLLDRSGICIEDCLKEIRKLSEQMQGILSAKVEHSQYDVDQAAAVEKQVQSEVSKQVQSVVNDNSELPLNGNYSLNFFDITFRELMAEIGQKRSCCYRIGLNKFLENTVGLKQQASAFSDLRISENALAMYKDNSIIILGVHQIPFHFVLIERGQVTILDQKDAALRMNNPGLYNLTLGFCNSRGKALPEEMRKIVKVKFLNGDSHYTKAELKYVEEWLKDVGPQMMLEMFQNNILKGHSHKAAAYKGSRLETLFKKLINVANLS